MAVAGCWLLVTLNAFLEAFAQGSPFGYDISRNPWVDTCICYIGRVSPSLAGRALIPL